MHGNDLFLGPVLTLRSTVQRDNLFNFEILWNLFFTHRNAIGLCVITFDPAQHLSHWLAVMLFFARFVLLAGIFFEDVLSRGTVCFEILLKLSHSPQNFCNWPLYFRFQCQ